MVTVCAKFSRNLVSCVLSVPPCVCSLCHRVCSLCRRVCSLCVPLSQATVQFLKSAERLHREALASTSSDMRLSKNKLAKNATLLAEVGTPPLGFNNPGLLAAVYVCLVPVLASQRSHSNTPLPPHPSMSCVPTLCPLSCALCSVPCAVCCVCRSLESVL